MISNISRAIFLNVNIKDIIYKLYNKLIIIEFFRYFLVGVIATIIDWGIFYILALGINLYYQFSLFISFALGSITNYSLNKIFTFRCKSKRIIRQFFVFSNLALISLLLSAAIMFIFVDLVSLHKMISRITTSFIMLVATYLMNKYLTFNKRFFK